MKNPDRDAVARLEQLPNIGRAMAGDLRMLGIEDPLQLWQALEQKTGQRHDPCVLDTFMAAIDFMEGGEARPWWSFTAERKRLYGKIVSIKGETLSCPEDEEAEGIESVSMSAQQQTRRI